MSIVVKAEKFEGGFSCIRFLHKTKSPGNVPRETLPGLSIAEMQLR
jgi:hypothetical protein